MVIDLLERALQHHKEKKRSAFVTLTRTAGSSPRKAGAKMLVVDAGGKPLTYGSIGGGSLELCAASEALALLQSSGAAAYFVKDLAKDLDMNCGGSVEYFIEPLSAPSQLIICGGGHIGHAVYEIMKDLDFRITVADPQPETANAGRFPKADQIIGSFADDIMEKEIAVTAQSYIVIVSRDHETDFRLVRCFFDKPWAYLGVIASRGKAAELKADLLREGKPEERIRRIRSPIGLPLGGSEPGEIAVSIAAEILQVRYAAETTKR